DIIPLAEHLLKVFSREMHKPIEGFSREAKQLLLSYDWPGNVRELQNAVERAVVLTRYNFIMPEDLPIARTSDSDRVQSLRLEDVERAHIKKVLEMTEYNISRAAELLGIHRNTLREKMKRYGLVRPESGS
ncbi:MAG: sigma-54-dependent Fis family transcriptional regulator, partial [Candidatus Hydrothermota bacterium]